MRHGSGVTPRWRSRMIHQDSRIPEVRTHLAGHCHRSLRWNLRQYRNHRADRCRCNRLHKHQACRQSDSRKTSHFATKSLPATVRNAGAIAILRWLADIWSAIGSEHGRQSVHQNRSLIDNRQEHRWRHSRCLPNRIRDRPNAGGEWRSPTAPNFQGRSGRHALIFIRDELWPQFFVLAGMRSLTGHSSGTPLASSRFRRKANHRASIRSSVAISLTSQQHQKSHSSDCCRCSPRWARTHQAYRWHRSRRGLGSRPGCHRHCNPPRKRREDRRHRNQDRIRLGCHCHRIVARLISHRNIGEPWDAVGITWQDRQSSGVGVKHQRHHNRAGNRPRCRRVHIHREPRCRCNHRRTRTHRVRRCHCSRSDLRSHQGGHSHCSHQWGRGPYRMCHTRSRTHQRRDRTHR